MSWSTAWIVAAWVFFIPGLIVGSPALFFAAMFCLWCNRSAILEEHLKEIKERLDK